MRHDCLMMNRNSRSPHRRGIKTNCAVIGAGAFAALTALSVAAGTHPGATTNYRAGSGDAPTNTTYSVPNAPTMNMGATATYSAPGTEPPTEMASPAVKAAPYSGG
jgi:hypothetical protein